MAQQPGAAQAQPAQTAAKPATHQASDLDPIARFHTLVPVLQEKLMVWEFVPIIRLSYCHYHLIIVQTHDFRLNQCTLSLVVISGNFNFDINIRYVYTEMCSERDSPLEPFVLPAPGQPELARLICGAWAHLCWPGSRSVHGSIQLCVIGWPRFAWRGHPKYCLWCLAWSRRPPSVNES